MPSDPVCDCGSCRICALQGTAAPLPPADPRTAAEVIAASDPHAAPANLPRRRGRADAGPDLFDTPAEDRR